MAHMAPIQPDPSPETLARGHEPDPLRVRTLVGLVIGFLAFAVVTHAALWFLLEGYAGEPRAVERPRSVARPEPGPPAGAPPLQPIPGHDETPWQDLARMRASEDRVFAAMGWKVERGRAQIPDAVVQAVAAGAATRPTTRSMPGGGK